MASFSWPCEFASATLSFITVLRNAALLTEAFLNVGVKTVCWLEAGAWELEAVVVLVLTVLPPEPGGTMVDCTFPWTERLRDRCKPFTVFGGWAGDGFC